MLKVNRTENGMYNSSSACGSYSQRVLKIGILLYATSYTNISAADFPY